MMRAWLTLGLLSVAACGLENEPPNWTVGPSDETTGREVQSVIEKPQIDPTESEGRICTEKGPVVGTAQPGSTVVAVGTGGEATTQAGSDGRFCVAVPLAKGQQNRIEVYSVHSQHGTSQTEVISLTHAGMNCPGTTPMPAQQLPEPVDSAEQLARVVQVRASESPRQGSDRAMIDGDPSTYVHYKVGSLWSLVDWRSDNMWIWFSLADAVRIEEIRIQWRDSIGRGNRYAEKYYVGLTDSDQPGDPPPPPTSAWIFDSQTAPAPSQWQWDRPSGLDESGRWR
jgi:hypothetical protein